MLGTFVSLYFVSISSRVSPKPLYDPLWTGDQRKIDNFETVADFFLFTLNYK
jgi:hypothetical protein